MMGREGGAEGRAAVSQETCRTCGLRIIYRYWLHAWVHYPRVNRKCADCRP